MIPADSCVIVLPVVRIEREALSEPPFDFSNIVDLHAWVWARDRLRVERRAMTPLLPPCDCDPG